MFSFFAIIKKFMETSKMIERCNEIGAFEKKCDNQ